MRTIRTKYYACSDWPALVTLCYDNPSSSRPGVDTAELGRDGGRDRDGSLYCPKTQDSLNAQRVPSFLIGLETWSSITHLPRLIQVPVICPVCLVACLQHAVCYTDTRDTGTSQPCHCHCCCFSLFNLFLVFSREPRPRTGDSESWDQNKP